MELEEKNWKQKITSFFLQSKRVWYVLKKPSSEEFKKVTKICAIGILLIGAAGFVVAYIVGMFR